MATKYESGIPPFMIYGIAKPKKPMWGLSNEIWCYIIDRYPKLNSLLLKPVNLNGKFAVLREKDLDIVKLKDRSYEIPHKTVSACVLDYKYMDDLLRAAKKIS